MVVSVNIHLILGQVLRSARAGFSQQIEIHEIYDPSLPEIAADTDRLQRALSNILKNASEAITLKFERPDLLGRIVVRTRYQRGLRRNGAELPIEVTITDNGGGISEDILEDAFKPFVTTKTNGTGLGLSMVARIIDELDGVVEIENTNTGCEFRLRFPIWSEAWTEQ